MADAQILYNYKQYYCFCVTECSFKRFSSLLDILMFYCEYEIDLKNECCTRCRLIISAVGIAGTVYCMMFGTYMQVKQEGGVWRTHGVFTRNVHTDLWQDFFHTLLNVPDCSSLPCLRSLRLQQNYSSKLRSLKNRPVVQILEARSSRR